MGCVCISLTQTDLNEQRCAGEINRSEHAISKSISTPYLSIEVTGNLHRCFHSQLSH